MTKNRAGNDNASQGKARDNREHQECLDNRMRNLYV